MRRPIRHLSPWIHRPTIVTMMNLALAQKTMSPPVGVTAARMTAPTTLAMTPPATKTRADRHRQLQPSRVRAVARETTRDRFGA